MIYHAKIGFHRSNIATAGVDQESFQKFIYAIDRLSAFLNHARGALVEDSRVASDEKAGFWALRRNIQNSLGRGGIR
jgi:hypothetical protein